MGQVEERAIEGARKLYAVTEAGLAFLTENEREAEAALARLEQLRRRGEALNSGPVFRAMSNLKAALQQRLANKPDKQLIFSVADAIDEAARKMSGFKACVNARRCRRWRPWPWRRYLPARSRYREPAA